MYLSHYQKSGFGLFFLDLFCEKLKIGLILGEIWSVLGPVLANLGPEYKVEALVIYTP